MNTLKKTITLEPFPLGKTFAISIIDDTDGATFENINTVYNSLRKRRILITKTVWPLNTSCITGTYPSLPVIGDTLENEKYADFCQELKSEGFEIAMHGASAGNSTRKQIIAAYEKYKKIFGSYPNTNIMHSKNIENIYWGKYVANNKLLSKLISLYEPLEFSGHNKNSPYYWGDICKEYTKYIRLFDSLAFNTLSYDPSTPFHDYNKPDVNYWFSSSYAAGTRLFTYLQPGNLIKLRRERGASILHLYCRHYSYFDHFSKKYKVHPLFEKAINYLDQFKDGWFVPVNVLLDRIRQIREIKIVKENNHLIIKNNSNQDIHEIAIQCPDNCTLYDNEKRCIKKNNLNQFGIGDLKGLECKKISYRGRIDDIQYYVIEKNPNYAKLLLGQILRIFWQFKNGRKEVHCTNDPPWVSILDEELL